MKRTLIIVRHCQSDWNAEGRLSGQDDTARLTTKGEDQALALAMQLIKFPIASITCSGLIRTLQTADLLTPPFQVPTIQVDRRWCEVGLGELDGKLRTEVESLPNGADLLASLRGDYDFRRFGGEDRETVLQRQLLARDEIFRRHPEDSVALVVGHGSALRTFLRHFHPEHEFHQQGGYNIVEFESDI